MAVPRLLGQATLLLVVCFGTEETCTNTETCDKNVVLAMANGASMSEGPRGRLELGAAECATRGSLEAAVSRAVCGNAASCLVKNGRGLRASKCADLDLTPEGYVAYAIPREKRFVFPSEEVGYLRELPHLNMSLLTLALEPRLFLLEGFFTAEDADALIADALAIDDDEHKLIQSSTGPSGYHASKVRTSDNAWVKSSPTSIKLQHRAFDMLGFETYNDREADGIQVLRYNHSKAYVPHTDYLSVPRGTPKKDMEPSLGGANRLATIFLYLSEVDQGGQTCFVDVERPTDLPASVADVLELRDYSEELAESLNDEVGTFEAPMLKQCYSKLAVRPKKARAVLYYSQHPDGRLDPKSKHGGCPVLGSSPKWAANLWVWNKPMPFSSTRFGGDEKEQTEKPDGQVKATFHNAAGSGLELFWKTSKMVDLPPGEAMSIQTFVGHKFKVMRGKKLIREFTIEKDKEAYHF